MVKKMIASNIETKKKSESYSDYKSDVSGVNHVLTDIDQGITDSLRIGNEIRLLRFKMKGVLQAPSNGDSAIVRVILFIPKVIDSLISTDVDVFDPIDTDKFTVLTDRLFCLDGAAGPGCRMLNINKSFHKGIRKGLQVVWNGDTGMEITKNRLAWYFVSNIPVGSAEEARPRFSGWHRIWFKDA